MHLTQKMRICIDQPIKLPLYLSGGGGPLLGSPGGPLGGGPRLGGGMVSLPRGGGGPSLGL